jgi:hypothetical protein
VFVGGTGRSGTTVAGALISSHPQYAGLDFEVRVHLATDKVGHPKRPVAWMRNHVMERYDLHLHKVISSAEMTDILDAYEKTLEEGTPEQAAFDLMEGIMRPVAESQGKPSWVDMTPLNAMRTNWLSQIFPNMRMIHMLRDGRDVAASVANAWGRMNPEEALDWWQVRIEQIDNETKRAPEGIVKVVEFESLAKNAREKTFQEILTFLSLEEHPAMRDFFETRLTPDRANIGRWRRSLNETGQEKFSAQYRRILEALKGAGIDWVADPDSVS